MSDFKQHLEDQLKDPEFRKEYENAQLEFDVCRAILNARLEGHMTQKELAEKTGIRQSNISRIECGASTPNVATLQAIAKGLGKRLRIDFC
jgi:ribosome-binding protein aMBF1 (putative translation factor)